MSDRLISRQYIVRTLHENLKVFRDSAEAQAYARAARGFFDHVEVVETKANR